MVYIRLIILFILQICSELKIEISDFSSEFLKFRKLENKETQLNSIYKLIEYKGFKKPSAVDVVSFLFPRILGKEENGNSKIRKLPERDENCKRKMKHF